MKRLFLVMAVLAVLTTTVFANVQDPRTPIELGVKDTVPYASVTRDAPAYEFFTNPVTIIDNFYDYFPGSYTGSPMQRVEGALNGNWIVYHTKATASSNRRVYKAFVDATGNVVSNIAFGTNDIWEGYPGVAVTPQGKPVFAYHVNLDADSDLEVGFGYDAVIGGSVIEMHSDLLQILDNPASVEVNGETVETNEFIWPSVQLADSPMGEGYYRVYVMAKNATTNGGAVSENVYVVYKDVSEMELESWAIDATGWGSTTIPTLDEWNVSPVEWRRPFMAFKAYEDKIYYVGYHLAYTDSEDGETIDEPTLDIFECDNYGEGTWVHHSIHPEMEIENPAYVDPTTGEDLVPANYYFLDENDEPYTEGELTLGVGQSGHFNVSIDAMGKIHMPLFYTIETNEATYYPGLHVVKDLSFDTNTHYFNIVDVYPSAGFNPMNFTSNTTGSYANPTIWKWWDQDGDGAVDEVLDDGSYDGVDDGVTAEDTDYWGRPIVASIWPYMYWDSAAADNAMMFHLHTAHITEANEQGMMAMVWQDSDKARLYNNYPDDYPEYADYAQMCDIVISVSQDNGVSWSEPIVMNGVDTPELAANAEIPEFPYPSNKIDFISEDTEAGTKLGRLYMFYLDDDTYGSSVQTIGQETGGQQKYFAIDITFPPATGTPVTSSDVEVATSMLNQNYPNPFNPETTIAYNVVKNGEVKLNVYNVKGQLVKTLVNADQNAGGHTVVWNGVDNSGNNVASGVYFYKVENGGRSEMKKMVLMK